MSSPDAPPSSLLVLTVAYDGSRFSGSQLQPDVPTVQRAIEAAARRLTSGPPRVLFAGRTDRGVHASGQVVAVRPGILPPPGVVAAMLDRRLAPAIRVVSWTTADATFDPRHDALSREYRYVLRLDPGPSPFQDPYGLPVPSTLDWDRMQEAADRLTGSHDFTAFTTIPSQQERLRRTLDEVELRRSADRVILRFRAQSFLRGQIRNMVGALLAVGAGSATPDDITSLLDGARKDQVPPPAPPDGLYLTAVTYAPDSLHGPFRPLHPSQKALDGLGTA